MKKLIKNNLIIFWFLPFLLGLFSSYSLPPYNFIFINFIIFPTLLFIVFELRKLKKNLFHFFKVGWLFGFGYFLTNLYWIVYSLSYDDIFKILIPFALIIIPSFLAVFYGVAIILLFKININKKLTAIIIFSLVFSIIEYIRGSILSGFPWNLIAYSWVSFDNSLQILSLIGTYSFNLISITLFTLPFVFFFKKYRKVQIRVLFFLLMFIFTNYIYGFFIINAGEKNILNKQKYVLKIISPKIPISKFFNNLNEKEILVDLINLSKPEKDLPTIFIWPEGILPGIYFDELDQYKNLFLDSFSNNHLIIMGINTHHFDDGVEKIYNSMVVFDNSLKLIGKYDKKKLVPFGEYLPIDYFFDKIGLKKITYGYESFSNGKDRNSILISNENIILNFLPLICYEIIYSGNINFDNKNFDLIINISEDGWFGNSIGPYQHFSHSIFRAIEEGKSIVRSANNGISAYINSNGIVLDKLKSTQRGTIEIKNLDISNKTFFSRFGNKIFFYFVLFYISLIFFIQKRET